MTDLKELAGQLVGLTVKEVKELTDILKKEHGIEPAVAAVATVSTESGGADQKETKEKTEFDLLLKEVGPQKLKIVKMVKELTGLGLREAKGLVDSAPKVIKEKAPKDEAESMKKSLEELQAVVELK